MVKKLYEVRNRSGDLILENVTSGEIKEELHCTTAQIMSRKTDFELLLEFEFVCDRLLGNGKGKK